MTNVSVRERRERFEHRDIQREKGHVTMEVEIGMMCVQAKEHQGARRGGLE